MPSHKDPTPPALPRPPRSARPKSPYGPLREPPPAASSARAIRGRRHPAGRYAVRGRATAPLAPALARRTTRWSSSHPRRRDDRRGGLGTGPDPGTESSRSRGGPADERHLRVLDRRGKTLGTVPPRRLDPRRHRRRRGPRPRRAARSDGPPRAALPRLRRHAPPRGAGAGPRAPPVAHHAWRPLRHRQRQRQRADGSRVDDPRVRRGWGRALAPHCRGLPGPRSPRDGRRATSRGPRASRRCESVNDHVLSARAAAKARACRGCAARGGSG